MSIYNFKGYLAPPRQSLSGELIGFNRRTGQPVQAMAGGESVATPKNVITMACIAGAAAYFLTPSASKKSRNALAVAGSAAVAGFITSKLSAAEAQSSVAGLGSYSDLSPDFYKTFQHDNWQHPGSSGWSTANVPGWGNNPNLQMFSRRGVGAVAAAGVAGSALSGASGTTVGLALNAGLLALYGFKTLQELKSKKAAH